MSLHDDLMDLEQKIQVPSWSKQYPELTTETQAALKQWLLLKGMPKQKLDNLDWTRMGNCYAIKNYFEVVVGNRPRKLDPRNNKSLLGGDQNSSWPRPEPEPEEDYDEVFDPLAQTPKIQDQDLSQKVQAQIEQKLERKFMPQIENSIRAQGQQVQRDVINKFSSGELKIQLSDQAKTEIKSLVLKTSADFLAQNLPPKEVVIKIPDKNIDINVGHVHKEFPTLLKALSCKLHTMLVGTSSSSKTTSSAIAAKALDLPFYHMGAAPSEFKYSGYEDGYGKYHSTPFRMAFENGGLILLDEYDGSIPAAQMFVQAALANYTCHFPDKIVEAHPDFVCIAACNTYGRGSDRQYTSRNQQDAAALDRFVVLDWDIDEDLEAQLFGDGRKYWDSNAVIEKTPIIEGPDTMSPGDWVRRIQKIRHAVHELGERHLVTMRASDFGSRLLQAGLGLKKVEEMCVWKGLNPSTVEKIKHHAQL